MLKAVRAMRQQRFVRERCDRPSRPDCHGKAGTRRRSASGRRAGDRLLPQPGGFNGLGLSYLGRRSDPAYDCGGTAAAITFQWPDARRIAPQRRGWDSNPRGS